jgi:hypothetical protein
MAKPTRKAKRQAKKLAYRQRLEKASAKALRAFNDARVVEPGQAAEDERRRQFEHAIER